MAVEWGLKGGGWDEAKNDLDGGLDGGLEKRNVQKFFSRRRILRRLGFGYCLEKGMEITRC